MSFSLKTKLLPHQLETVKFAANTKFYGDFSVMGTGKSLSALGLICEVKKRAVIVCPPSLVYNWINEINTHTTLTCSTGIKLTDSDVHIVPYTKVKFCEEIFKNSPMVFTDEGQFLKNLDAQRTQAFHYVFSKFIPEYYGYLSGTPIKNRIPEAYSMLLLLGLGPNKPKIVDKYPSFYTFCSRFTHARQTPYGTSFDGMKNVEELRTYIKPFTIRHSESVLKLPELSESNVVAFYSEHSELKKQFELFQAGGLKTDIKVKAEAAATKAKFTSTLVREAVDQGRGPVVVFSDHKKPLEIMELELSTLKVAQVTGDVSVADRDKRINSFKRGELDVLLCTIGVASFGHNFTVANLLVCNDPPWDPGSFDQMRKRVHRLGQERPCQILCVVGSRADEYIYDKIRRKSLVIKKVIGD